MAASCSLHRRHALEKKMLAQVLTQPIAIILAYSLYLKFGASLLTVNRRLYIEALHLCGEHSSNYLEKREREEFTLIFFREFEIVSCHGEY